MLERHTVEPLFSLTGKTAVVTGAAGYLGRIFTEALLDAGAHVILMGRGEKLLHVARQLEACYGKGYAEAKTVDFFDTETYRRILQDLARRPSGIDILINNAFEFSKETGFNDPSGASRNAVKGPVDACHGIRRVLACFGHPGRSRGHGGTSQRVDRQREFDVCASQPGSHIV